MCYCGGHLSDADCDYWQKMIDSAKADAKAAAGYPVRFTYLKQGTPVDIRLDNVKDILAYGDNLYVHAEDGLATFQLSRIRNIERID